MQKTHVLMLDVALATGPVPGLRSEDEGGQIAFQDLAPLPVPISNNAVTLLVERDEVHLFSALGLESGKKWSDTSSRSFHFSANQGGWDELQPVPGASGRLAASAVTVAGEVYVFGGYTAAGGDNRGRMYFAGGSVNPYNFDGIGFNGEPAQPEAGLFSYNFDESAWECNGNLPVATMDHRGLPSHGWWFYLIGGMLENQQVSDRVVRFRPAQGRTCP